MATIKGNLADGKPMQVGGWYNGQQWDGSKLSAPGTLSSGQKVSDEVIAQSGSQNVSYVQQQRQTQAQDIQAPVNISLPSGQPTPSTSSIQGQVDQARKNLETTLAKQKEEADKKVLELRKKEQETLAKVEPLTKPFREELETAERERLYINENFEANQRLTNELETLLQESNDLIEQQRNVTGLSAIRNPRIEKILQDTQARAYVLQSVMAARNSQIGQAQILIDRSIQNIAQDRQDQLSYYNTVLSLNREDIISLDTESKQIAEKQIGLLENDLGRAQETADYVKKLLLDPQTATLLADSGASLNDSVQTINAKIRQAQYSREVRDISNEMALSGAQVVISPSGIPADRLITLTDSQGKKHFYAKPAPKTGSTGIASDFIQRELFKSTGLEKVKPEEISTQVYSKILSRTNEIVAPNVSPSAGIGSIYYDSLGRKWKYEKTGWKLIN